MVIIIRVTKLTKYNNINSASSIWSELGLSTIQLKYTIVVWLEIIVIEENSKTLIQYF